MAHIAIMSVPLHGHVNPLLGVAAELVGRGHRVTFATDAEFAALVAETGATAVGYDSVLPGVRAGGGSWLSADDDGGQAVEVFAKERDAVLPQVADAYREDTPDLVLYDTVTGHAPVLARWWGVPEVQFSPTQALPADAEGPGFGSGRGSITDRFPCIVAIPRSLQYEADRVAGNHVFVGPVAWQRKTHGDWEPPRDDRPVALVSLGTTYNTRTEIFGWAAEAFRVLEGRDWHVVVATGRNTDPSDLAGLPPGTEVHQWVPQQQVLARAEAFVTVGGTGSVLEGLANGVPLVVLPQALEQFVNAERVASLGLGRAVLPADLGADAVRAAVHGVVSDPGVGTRVAAVRDEIAASGGARAAADIVEAELRTPASNRAGTRSHTDREDHR